MKVQTGDIIAFHTQAKTSSPVTWLSWAIRKVTNQKYNHTGVIVYVWGIPMVYESMGSGFKSTPLFDRMLDSQGDGIAVMRRKSKFNIKEFAINATNLLGHTKYDVPGLIDQLKFAITKKWNKRTEEEAKSNMYCWESTMYLHQDSGLFKKWWQVDPDIFFKNDIFEYIIEEKYVNEMTYSHLTT